MLVMEITCSPNAQSIITLPDEAMRRNTEYLKQLRTADQIVECARNKDRESLISQGTPNDWFCSSNPFFTPDVDGNYLIDKPINLLKKETLRTVQYLLGYLLF